jgi:hypothetical protein
VHIPKVSAVIAELGRAGATDVVTATNFIDCGLAVGTAGGEEGLAHLRPEGLAKVGEVVGFFEDQVVALGAV